MSGGKGLPLFFQSGGGTTLLEELTNFDLEGDMKSPEDLLDSIIDDVPLNEEMNEDTFADSFGDFNPDRLPEYLQNSLITPGRNAVPDDDGDTDIADILNTSTAERLKDQAATLALSKALGNPNLIAKSASKMSGPPGLPPGLTPTPTKGKETRIDVNSLFGNSNPSFGTPYADKVRPATSNPPGLIPSREVSASFAPFTPPPLTPKDVPGSSQSVVSAILSPPPSESGAIFSPKPNFGKGKYMHPSDVRFVVNKALQPLETLDPYADDFYFIQYTIKKNSIEREKALQEKSQPPPPVKVPLPTWKDTKERIKGQISQSRAAFQAKVKEWEEKEQVLGHRIKSEVSRPRELLSLPTLQDLDFDLNDDEEVEWRAPFTSRLWSTRLAVQRGYEALFTVQELQYLLTSPLIQANVQAVEEIKHEIDVAVQVLSQSLGIRSIENESFLGLTTGSTIQLDGRHIAAIIQTTTGKKLLSRGLKLLPIQHRWTLIPIVLARLFMLSTSTSSASSSGSQTNSSNTTANTISPSSGGEAMEVEKRLLRAMIEYFQFTYKQYLEMKANQVEIVISYATDLLQNVKQILKNIMITQLEKNQLREALLGEKTRAEVMHIVISLGDTVASIVESQVAEEWKQTKDAFMSLLEG